MTRKEGDRRKHLSKLQIKGQKAQWIDVLTFPTSETQKIRDYPCFPQCEKRKRLSGWHLRLRQAFLSTKSRASFLGTRPAQPPRVLYSEGLGTWFEYVWSCLCS